MVQKPSAMEGRFQFQTFLEWIQEKKNVKRPKAKRQAPGAMGRFSFSDICGFCDAFARDQIFQPKVLASQRRQQLQSTSKNNTNKHQLILQIPSKI